MRTQVTMAAQAKAEATARGLQKRLDESGLASATKVSYPPSMILRIHVYICTCNYASYVCMSTLLTQTLLERKIAPFQKDPKQLEFNVLFKASFVLGPYHGLF